MVLRNAKGKRIGADTETSSLKWYNGGVIGHCLGCIDEELNSYGFYIPTRHTTSMCGIVPTNYPFVKTMEMELSEFYDSEEYKKVFFNLKFDMNMLWRHDIPLKNVEDAMLLMFLRNENERNHRLKDLSRKYVDAGSKDEADKVAAYVKQHRIFKLPNTSYANIPIDILGPYGAKDAVLTLMLWLKYAEFLGTKEDSIQRDGVRKSIYVHERDYAATVARMERVGFPYDLSVGEAIVPELTIARDRLLEEIHHIAHCEFNPGSSPELAKVMKGLGHVSSMQGKTADSWGRPELMELQNELGECIACWRNLDHNLTTISDGLPKWVHQGRIYGTYNQIGARTGRASASEPNLQAIPKRLPRYSRVPEFATRALKLAFGIRKAFKAPPGYSVLSIDQSQFELRLLNHYAKDPTMAAAFNEGKDIHSFVGSLLFGTPYDDFARMYEDGEEDAKRNRDIAKEIDFAVVYGAYHKRIRKTLAGYGIALSLNEVRNFYLRYMDVFSKIREFIDRVQATVRRRGYLFNYYGRHKRIPAHKAYVGVNHLIQGVTADMLKECKMKAEVRLETCESQIMMAVHDEIDFLLHDDEHFLIPELVTIMQDFDWCSTPIVAKASIGPSWGELEPYDFT